MVKLGWSWKKTPEGYSGLNGKALLHKKGRKWFLTIDGKDHEIRARKPTFDDAEGLLKSLGKTAYNYDRRQPPRR